MLIGNLYTSLVLSDRLMHARREWIVRVPQPHPVRRPSRPTSRNAYVIARLRRAATGRP